MEQLFFYILIKNLQFIFVPHVNEALCHKPTEQTPMQITVERSWTKTRN